MPCGTTKDGWVMVERFERMWSIGEGTDKPPQYSCLENPVNSMKRQKDRGLLGGLNEILLIKNSDRGSSITGLTLC